MAKPEEKSERLKMVEAVFGPGSPASLKLETDILALDLELAKQKLLANIVIGFSALPEPDKKDKPTSPTP